MIGLAMLGGYVTAATVAADFTAATDVPVKVSSYTATGNTVKITLGFAPPTGTSLMIVKNKGTEFITGQFSNLTQGQKVKLTFNGISYRFVANYYGGTGNDLVLQWPYQHVYSWGGVFPPQVNPPLPVDLSQAGTLAGRTVLQVASAGEHNLALCADGAVAAWGSNGSGQLGDASNVATKLPVLVQNTGFLAGKTVIAVAAGSEHSLALCSDSTLAAWGANEEGQLGDGGTAASNSPVAVVMTGALAGKRPVAIAAGGGHSLVLCSDGTLVAWGDNSGGTLGNGINSTSNVPVAVNQSGILAGKTVVSISAANTHDLALCSDGTVVAWGRGNDGALGIGSASSSNVPVKTLLDILPAGTSVVSVSAGSGYSLALCSDGTALAWGMNTEGKLGTGDLSGSWLPRWVSMSGALSGKTLSALSAGSDHSLALGSDGTLAAWGSNRFYELGDGTTNGSLLPVPVVNSGDLAGKKIISIAAGNGRSLALAAALLSNDSQLAGVSVSSTVLNYNAPAGSLDLTGSVAAGTTSVTVTPVSHHSLAKITVNGTSVVSGSPSIAIPLAAGNTSISITVTAEDGSSTAYPVTLSKPQNVTAIFTRAEDIPVTCAALNPTGLTANFSLGFSPPTGTNLTLVRNTGLNFIAGQFANLSHGQVVSLSYNGIIYKFVANYFGGSGNDLVLEWYRRSLVGWGRAAGGVAIDSEVPVALEGTGALAGKTVLKVVAGPGGQNFAICSDGTVAAWGGNDSGQLGDGSQISPSVPVAVDRTGVLAGKTVVSLAAGSAHALALCSDGTLAAWGSNSQGSLGTGTTEHSNSPVAVDRSGVLAGKTVVAISANAYHSLALCSDGTIAAWGNGSNGELGTGQAFSTGSLVPLAVDRSGVLAGKMAMEIAAGGIHNLALCTDGTAVAWGGNGDGQLGDGTNTPRLGPVAIPAAGALAGKTVNDLAAAGFRSLALCSDGSVAAWGRGYLGNGYGDTTGKSIPVAVSGFLTGKTVTALSAGVFHTLALTSEGILSAWGSNLLGDGTTNIGYSPVAVDRSGFLAGKTVLSAVAGNSYSLAIAAVPTSSKLDKLVVSSGGITPVFSSDVSSYAATLPAGTASITVTPIARDPTAIIKVNGVVVISGIPSAPVAFPIEVVVSGTDASATTYNISAPSGIDATFYTAADIPAVFPEYFATGWTAKLALGFSPAAGTNLMVVKNTGIGFINGNFTNLLQGQPVDLPYGGKIYHFVANYHGGTGNDLVLEWANRSVASWGCSFVQFSDGSVFSQKSPIAVDRSGVLRGKTVVSIASSAATTVALCADGTLVQWQGLGAGMIGDAPPVQTNVPVEVSGTGALEGKRVVSVATGSGTSVALCSDGTLAAWGYNGYGQLGDGTTTSSDVPVTVISRGALVGKSIVSVSVGGRHCLVLCSDGTMASWGQNGSGQLGNGNKTGLDTDSPVQVVTTGVLAGKSAVAIGTGLFYSLALCSDGTLASWGDAGNGVLGNGYDYGTFSSPVLVNVSGVLVGKTVSAISVSSNNSAALCSDGSVAVWGYNENGQLGTGTIATAYVPVALNRTGVLAGKSIVSVDVGDGCMFATCSDGTVASWGRNTYGQLGDGTLIDRKLPVLVDSAGEFYGKKPIAIASGGGAGHSHAILAEPDSGFIAWMSGRLGVSNMTPSGDSDQDGIPNLMEYVLNGDPAASSTTILPTPTVDGADFVFQFSRLAGSTGDTTQVFQYSADMNHWSDVNITPPVDAGIAFGTVDTNGNQSVVVTVPKGVNTRLFGRLKVSRP